VGTSNEALLVQRQNDDQVGAMNTGSVESLGHYAPFRTLKSNADISDKEHRNFFTEFINRMYSVMNNYIGYPSTGEELKNVIDRYEKNYLPGCGGLVDVVQAKWSNSPAGDVNRTKGEEGYPSLAFEVVTGFDRQILGVSSAHFGTQNDRLVSKCGMEMVR
jgi:hypothetical protein